MTHFQISLIFSLWISQNLVLIHSIYAVQSHF